MSPWQINRRHLLRSLVAGSATLTTRSAYPAERDLTFGLTPVFLAHDLDLINALQQYLKDQTGRSVQLVQRRTYQEITSLLLSGRLTAAWICGYPFVQHRDRLSLVAVPVWHGKPLYQSYLIVGKDRNASTIWDLEGGIHAFSDPDSNSGFLVTCELLAQHNKRPYDFFSRTIFTYGHRNVVRAVASGLADSGSVDGYVWEVLNRIESGLTSETKIIRRSEWLGFPPIAALTSQVDAPDVGALRAALLGMHNTPLGQRILDTLDLNGFSAENPAMFDTIAAKVDTVARLG